MHGMADKSILVAPLLAVRRGHNIMPTSGPARGMIVGYVNSGKTTDFTAVAAKILADADQVALERALLVTRSFEDALTRLARQASSEQHDTALRRPQNAAPPLPVVAPVDQLAVRGIDVADVQVLITGLAPLGRLVQRVGRIHRWHRNTEPPAGPRPATAAIVVDEAVDVSEIVQLVRAAELRRLSKVERRLWAALRRLAAVSHAAFPVRFRAPSRSVSIARLPLTSARTLTAPPLAA